MRSCNVLLAILLITVLSIPRELAAQQQSQSPSESHVVSANQLRAHIVARAAVRKANIQEIRTLLGHDEVRREVGALAQLDRIEQAIPSLDDDTLARLAADSRAVNDQITAGTGALGWTIVVIALIVGLLLTIAFAEAAANS